MGKFREHANRMRRELSAWDLVEARQRASRRESPANFLLVILFLCAWPSFVYSLFRLMWYIHTRIYPHHINRLGEFWGRGISNTAFIPSFLMLMPLLVAAVPLSMLVTNLLCWLLPSVRRILDAEARNMPGTSFAESMADVWIATVYIVPICLILSLLGAVTLRHLR